MFKFFTKKLTRNESLSKPTLMSQKALKQILKMRSSVRSKLKAEKLTSRSIDNGASSSNSMLASMS